MNNKNKRGKTSSPTRTKHRGGVASVVLITLALVALVESVQFLVQGTDYFLYRVFASRQEAARREVFEQSKAYRDGVAQELWDMEVQYAKADPPGQAALRSTILHRMASYDQSQLPQELRQFVERLRAEQLSNSSSSQPARGLTP